MTLAAGPLEIIALAGVWVWALWSRDMRSLRTLMLLAATTATFLGLSIGTGMVFLVLRVLLLASATGLLLLRPDLFFTRSKQDLEFDQDYSRVQQMLSDLARQRLASRIGREQFGRGIGKAVADLKRLAPPDEGWATIHQATIDDLERWLNLGGGDSTKPEPELHISAIRSRHEYMREARRRSWRRSRAVEPPDGL